MNEFTGKRLEIMLMFDIVFALIFFGILGMFVWGLVKNIQEWNSNNHSPRLSVDVKVVAKRDQIHRHHHRHNGHGHTTRSHSYHVTFEVESGDRMELKVPSSEYGVIVEGDMGVLTFQGTRYLGFERKY